MQKDIVGIAGICAKANLVFQKHLLKISRANAKKRMAFYYGDSCAPVIQALGDGVLGVIQVYKALPAGEEDKT